MTDRRHLSVEADPPDYFNQINKDISMEYNHYVLNAFRTANNQNYQNVSKDQSGIFQFMEFKMSKTMKRIGDESYNARYRENCSPLRFPFFFLISIMQKSIFI